MVFLLYLSCGAEHWSSSADVLTRMAVYTCYCYGKRFNKVHAVTLEQFENWNLHERCLKPLTRL